MKKVLIIIGTRPEAIKTIMLHKLLMNNDLFEPTLLCTGQHEKMVEELLDIFKVKADISFSIPDEFDSLSSKTGFLLSEIEKEINLLNPDYIVVQGDTLSSFCGALSAHFLKVPLVHIEAGLRSGNKWGPFPEEMLRLLNDMLSDYHMAPTRESIHNLKSLGLKDDQIILTGNTGIDALSYIVQKLNIKELAPTKEIIELINDNDSRPTALLTLHRRESMDLLIDKYIKPLDKAAEKNNLRIFFPLHPNPALKNLVENNKFRNIKFLPALNYVDMVYLMQSCDIFFTDSGGIQEEAVFLGKPLIVLRNETERQEAVIKGLNEMIQHDNLSGQISRLLSKGDRPSDNLYGDGNASIKIVAFLNSLIS